MSKEVARSITAISIFSVNKASGHSVVDDGFYYTLLKEADVSFLLYAPRYSLARLADLELFEPSDVRPIHVEKNDWATIFKACLSIRVPRNSRVIFLGYSEKFVLVFYLLKLFKRYELVLVATNNICRWRLDKYRERLKWFFSIVGRRLAKFVVHTQEEKMLCRSISTRLFGKTVVKKHHLMIPIALSRMHEDKDRYVVSFFGPDKVHKPIEPMIDLIKKDADCIFDYRFYGVDEKSVVNRFDLGERSNVDFVEGWLSDEEYRDELARATFVMLSHDKSFEPKLSGNLCDCIAMGVPFLSSNIEPVKWYMQEYGPMGYVFDFSNKFWADEFLGGFSPVQLESLRANLEKAALAHSEAAVSSDNLSALLK